MRTALRLLYKIKARGSTFVCFMKLLCLEKLFEAADQASASREREGSARSAREDNTLAIQRHMNSYAVAGTMNGFWRMQNCRLALEALDRRGWNRSFHQRLFHEEYLKSCTRVFFKRDGPGAFARSLPTALFRAY